MAAASIQQNPIPHNIQISADPIDFVNAFPHVAYGAATAAGAFAVIRKNIRMPSGFDWGASGAAFLAGYGGGSAPGNVESHLHH